MFCVVCFCNCTNWEEINKLLIIIYFTITLNGTNKIKRFNYIIEFYIYKISRFNIQHPMKINRIKNQDGRRVFNRKGPQNLRTSPIHSEYQFHFNHGPHSAKFGCKTTETTKRIRPRRKINAVKQQSIRN